MWSHFGHRLSRVPGSVRARNTLAGLVRRNEIDLEDAIRIVRDAERRMMGAEFSVASERVLRLAIQSRCSAYDCEFVALAQDLRVPFVTADRQLLAALPAVAVSPADLVR